MEPVNLTLLGPPRTKKNSQRILYVAAGRPIVAPSAVYAAYEQSCLSQLKRPKKAISSAVNVRCVYYMPTRRRVDLVNLLEATCDILVRAGVLEDDNCNVVAGHDGSRVRYDKERPRTEIEITEMEAEKL